MEKNHLHLRYGFAGLCCLLVGIGLARFSYTPILPLMINEGWINKLQAGYLGAANFSGYFLGAILARICIHAVGSRKIIQYALITCILSLFLCGYPLGSIWFYILRFIAGFCGALLMVATPTLIFSGISEKTKAKTGSLTFAGLGAGVVISGLVIPYLALNGLSSTWHTIGFLAAVIAMIAWMNLPKQEHGKHIEGEDCKTPWHEVNLPIIMLAITYFLFGIGLTPHTLFLVAYLTHYLNYSDYLGGLIFAAFGIGMLISPLTINFFTHRFSIPTCLTAAYISSTFIILLMLFFSNKFFMLSICFIMGFLFLSLIALTSAYLAKSISHRTYPAVWGIMTALFSLSQTFSAFGMSHLIQNGGNSYILVLLIAFIALSLSTIISVILLQKKFSHG